MSDMRVELLEERLNDFNFENRFEALQSLWNMVVNGKIEVMPEREIANMHCHTFFSFNGYGYSPTAIAWMAKKNGIKLIGIVDFDVLDGVDEFLAATELLQIRATCGVETRIFLPEFQTREINSPGEPGISYHMGVGFSTSTAPDSSAGVLIEMRNRATKRNLMMLERLNEYLAPVFVDYEKDILSLTPNGFATERHILTAMINTAKRGTADPVGFWAEKLVSPRQEVEKLYPDLPKFSNTIRTRLMKKEGVGYIQPDAGSFPKIEEFHQLIEESKALPCLTWLDGTSKGEQDIEELLDIGMSKGVLALNIVPDRNWNIPDPLVKKTKIGNLYRVVELARSADLPINIGTEMNSFGQKLVDDFDAPELAPVRQDFLDGAYCIYGHTLMERSIGKGYQSDWAVSHFPSRKQRNAFYGKLGRIVHPGKDNYEALKRLDQTTLTPDDIFSQFK